MRQRGRQPRIVVGSMLAELMEKHSDSKARVHSGLKGWFRRVSRGAFGVGPFHDLLLSCGEGGLLRHGPALVFGRVCRAAPAAGGAGGFVGAFGLIRFRRLCDGC